MCKKKDPNKKGFVAEFKQFISKGSVVDLAVGVIIGGAFTAIVTALTDSILKPIINWIFTLFGGNDALEGAYTVLKAVYVTDEVTQVKSLDLANSIYINWGAFITAVINFFLIALVLFCIVKIINGVREKAEQVDNKLKEIKEKKNEKPEEPAVEETK